MAGVRLKLNIPAFNAFRNSAEVVALLEQAGTEIVVAATSSITTHTESSAPFRVDTVNNPTRAVTFVATNNFDGMRAEATDRTLSKAVG